MQLPRYHRLRKAFYRLEGSRCGACDRLFFPSRPLCPSCRSEDMQAHRFNGSGTLYSYSRMTQSPRGFQSIGPYTVGMVRLDEGPLIMAQLTDVEGVELSIDMPVEMVTRKLREDSDHGYIVYGYKFRPVMRTARLDTGVATDTAADRAAAGAAAT